MTATGDDGPPEQRVSITVEVVEQFSERTPARVQIPFQNEATTARTFLFGPEPLFGPLGGDSSSGDRSHIIPAEGDGSFAERYANVVPPHPIEGCWRLADWYDLIDRGILWTADPDAVNAMTYVVLDDPNTDECLTAGTYRIEGAWGERYANSTDEWFDWGFTLALGR